MPLLVIEWSAKDTVNHAPCLDAGGCEVGAVVFAPVHVFQVSFNQARCDSASRRSSPVNAAYLGEPAAIGPGL